MLYTLDLSCILAFAEVADRIVLSLVAILAPRLAGWVGWWLVVVVVGPFVCVLVSGVGRGERASSLASAVGEAAGEARPPVPAGLGWLAIFVIVAWLAAVFGLVGVVPEYLERAVRLLGFGGVELVEASEAVVDAGLFRADCSDFHFRLSS